MSSPGNAPRPIKSRRYSPQFKEEIDYTKGPSITVEINEFKDRNGKISPTVSAASYDADNSAYKPQSPEQRSERMSTKSSLRMVKPQNALGYYAMIALLFNKIVGTGIFEDPVNVLNMTGSKGAALLCWLIGSCVAISGSVLYIEYGIRFPLTGGELYYLDFVWSKPTLMIAYMYGIMFVALRSSHANALSFGNAVQTAILPENAKNNPGVQRFLAVGIVGLVCLAHAYSRRHYIAISNWTAPIKFLLLIFIIIFGFSAYAGFQSSAARNDFHTPYGKENLIDAFNGTKSHPYFWGVALLSISRSFAGFENANLIIEEIRRPHGDENRVFRRSVKCTITVIVVLYMLVTLAFYIVLTNKELGTGSDILVIFLQKIFGRSVRAKQASGVLRAISSLGHVVSFTYSHVKVKQEIARMGILPFPEYFARSTADGIPGPALLLHFVLSAIVIVAVPASQTSLVFSVLYSFSRTWISVLLGLGLLFSWRLKSFRQGGERWRPQSFPGFGKNLAFYLVMSMALLYTVANCCYFVFMWITSAVGYMAHADPKLIPSVKWPALGFGMSVLGGLFWAWDRYILPALGYRFESQSEHLSGYVVEMNFVRYIKEGSPAQYVYESLLLLKRKILSVRTRIRRQRHADNDDLSEQIPLQQVYKTSDDRVRVGLRYRNGYSPTEN